MNSRLRTLSISIRSLWLAFAILFLAGSAFSSGPQEKLLYSFQGPSAPSGQDGEGPGSLISDTKGNMYGVTTGGGLCVAGKGEGSYCGTVFELSPPASGSGPWAETVIYEFGTNSGDGSNPVGNLVRDKLGNFYGVTQYSSSGVDGNYGCGNVYELSPPAQSGGVWTETVLYNFQGGNDGCNAAGTLVMDRKGNIFGATIYGGTLDSAVGPKGYDDGGIFEMSPPASQGGTWAESFTQAGGVVTFPYGGLTIDEVGTLYGATLSSIFQLIPPTSVGGTWTGRTLYIFRGGEDGSGLGGLNLDSKGNIYGVTEHGGTADGGTVFELLPPVQGGSPWTKTVLYSFKGGNDGYLPLGQMSFDKSGNLYGTTFGGGAANICTAYQGCGTVFKLTPGTTGWREGILHRFQGPYTDGSYPGSALLLVGQKIYGTAQGGTVSPLAYGAVFEIEIN
jgi:hypothetical protein